MTMHYAKRCSRLTKREFLRFKMRTSSSGRSCAACGAAPSTGRATSSFRISPVVFEGMIDDKVDQRARCSDSSAERASSSVGPTALRSPSQRSATAMQCLQNAPSRPTGHVHDACSCRPLRQARPRTSRCPRRSLAPAPRGPATRRPGPPRGTRRRAHMWEHSRAATLTGLATEPPAELPRVAAQFVAVE